MPDAPPRAGLRHEGAPERVARWVGNAKAPARVRALRPARSRAEVTVSEVTGAPSRGARRTTFGWPASAAGSRLDWLRGQVGEARRIMGKRPKSTAGATDPGAADRRRSARFKVFLRADYSEQ